MGTKLSFRSPGKRSAPGGTERDAFRVRFAYPGYNREEKNALRRLFFDQKQNLRLCPPANVRK